MPNSKRTFSEAIIPVFRESGQFTITAPRTDIAHSIIYESSVNLIGFLNTIHSFNMHIIGSEESEYLHSLTINERKKLLQQLCNNQAYALVNISSKPLPEDIINSVDLYIIEIKKNFSISYHQLIKLLDNTYRKNETCEHGSFVVIYNQGILITGDNGSGKSHLLAALVNRGHLWIADDVAIFYENLNGQVMGTSCDHLEPYIHAKGVGVINMDSCFGTANRLQKHSLAGVVHLSKNMPLQLSMTNTLNPQTTKKIASHTLPLWEICTTIPDLPLTIETCAKQLILNQRGIYAAEELSRTLDETIQSQYKKEG